jgi:hypothetical protein
MRKFRARAVLLGAMMLVVAMPAGCGSSSLSTKASSVGSTSHPASQAKFLPVALHLRQGSYSVSGARTTVSGTASKGASVSVNGTNASVRSGRWHDRLHLHIGSNQVEVRAMISGRGSTTRVIHVVRHHSAAELEALARARARRAEVKKLHEAAGRARREQREREEHEEEDQESRRAPAGCPNGTYENSVGNIVCSPYESETQPAGATAECEDGTDSFSESRSGTCSHHGGVKRWLNG